MKLRKLRRLGMVLVLIISVILLLWSIWPVEEATLVLPISPREMQIPTPESFLPLLRDFLTI